MIPSPLRALSDNIIIDPDKCIFCGICVETCILDNLRLQLAPCSRGCPIGQNCHGYVQLIARGRFDQALKIVHDRLPFAGILGRVCSHPCEDKCERRKTDGQPVAIRALKRFLDEHAQHGAPEWTLPPHRSQRVAIVGSGPAGMMAAWELRHSGCRVEIFEAAARPGGLLTYGIPRFRLPADVVEREFGYLEAIGVTTHLNTRVGSDLALPHLVDEYDAIFLAVGAGLSARLHIEGENAQGVQHGLEFLRSASGGAPTPAVGRKVIIIGGGNVAVDAAQTARLLGSESVVLVCLEQQHEMPAFPWEIQDAVSAGVEIRAGWGPTRLLLERGAVHAVEFGACNQVLDSEGRFSPCLDASNSCRLETDQVIVAIGQRAELDYLGGSGVATERGWIQTDTLTHQTTIPKVFAGGDAATGPKSVVDAMAAGREAAESIRRYLAGEDIRFGRSYLGPFVDSFVTHPVGASGRPRVTLPKHAGAVGSTLAEIEGPLSQSAATDEAARCLNCGVPEGHFRTCWFCLPCEVECPEDALYVEVPYLLR